ncbi:MAG: cobalamin B12-binding domain-containing protein [Betaproteobacteria bacterium]|nr:cobalamin B12-binding domain-containing protein [Betaproteobacteria bacterium]
MTDATQLHALRGRRILIAKPGLDGHDVGAKVIALALRDAGAEVIYTGLRKSPEYIARVAVEEGVDAVGLSVLSGSHRELVADTVNYLRRAGATGVRVFVGGTIPAEDLEYLRSLGVRGIYTSAMPLDDVVASVAQALAEQTT